MSTIRLSILRFSLLLQHGAPPPAPKKPRYYYPLHLPAFRQRFLELYTPTRGADRGAYDRQRRSKRESSAIRSSSSTASPRGYSRPRYPYLGVPMRWYGSSS